MGKETVERIANLRKGEALEKPMEDGIYRFRIGSGRKVLWVLVREGKLWLPLTLLPTIIWATSEKPIAFSGKQQFMMASDIIEEEPSQREDIEAFAKRFGLKI